MFSVTYVYYIYVYVTFVEGTKLCQAWRVAVSSLRVTYYRPGVGAGRPFTWGISEALGVTLGGVPLYVPVLVPVLYI